MTREKQYYEYKGKRYALDGSYISDLGYLMIRLFDEENKTWMNINLGSFEELILKKPSKSNGL